MKITFLIGNGFDLALGLNSSYSSVFSSPGVHGSIEDYSKINSCAKNFMDGFAGKEYWQKPQECTMWSDFETALVDYARKSDVSTDDFLELKRNLSINFITGVSLVEDNFLLDMHELTEFGKEICRKLHMNVPNKKSVKERYAKRLDVFKTSLLEFYKRLSVSDTNVVWNRIKGCNEIVIDFITYNYTHSLRQLFNDLKEKEELSYNIDENIIIPVKLGQLYYVHGNKDEMIEQYNKAFFGTTNEDDLRSIHDDKVRLEMDKTNRSFNDWISDSEILITYGLSLGRCDEYYWKQIGERVDNNALWIDFPYLTLDQKKSNAMLDERRKIEMEKCEKFVKKHKENVIVSTAPVHNMTMPSANIFEFPKDE